MLLCTIIVMKLLVGSILLDTGMAKPLENEDFRQYHNFGGIPYALPLPSAGKFGAWQSGFSPLGNAGVFRPQSVPWSPLNLVDSTPLRGQTFGASAFGSSGGFSVGMPYFFG